MRKLILALAIFSIAPLTTAREPRVETVMVPEPATVGHDATVGDAIKLMSDGGYRRLPIVDASGDLVGVVA